MRNKFLIGLVTCTLLASSCSGGQADAEIDGIDSVGTATEQSSPGSNSAAPDATNVDLDDSDGSAQSSETVDEETVDRSISRTGISTKTSATVEPSTLGVFELVCTIAKEASFDPILDGPSPLNFFIGNTDISESSTNDGDAETDISTGTGSSCPGGRADLSSYWVPATYNANGTVTQPDTIRITSGRLALDGTTIQAPPAGLTAISGDRDATTPQSAQVVTWNCFDSEGTPRPGYGANATSIIPACSSDESLTLQVRFPQCWDETLTPSSNPNHLDRSLEIPAVTGPGDTKISRECPSSHPAGLPLLTYEFRWSADTIGPAGSDGWYLSSDDTDDDGIPDVPGGTTSHAGWMSSWDSDTADTWVTNCIQTAGHCFAANLGNETSLS